MRNRGFVLMETIVVICVLSIVLVMLYGSYSNILNNVKKGSSYDNTEYLYKTYIIKTELEKEQQDLTGNVTKICSNFDNHNQCLNLTTLYNDLGVEAVYITTWSIRLNDEVQSKMEPTTQNYVKSLDPNDSSGYRIIVMFKQENKYELDNSKTKKAQYEYASLAFTNKV